MALRKIVHIDEELCDGCGLCVPSCAEGAIKIIDGKAKLLAENLCDGLGACLGECPRGAIKIEEREADDFDNEAVEKNLGEKDGGLHNSATGAIPPGHQPHLGLGGCPGSRTIQFSDPDPKSAGGPEGLVQESQLRQWPVQLHLVSPSAPYFQGADVLLAADCTAFAMADFHSNHLKGKALAVACPKLDQGQEIYVQKLLALIDQAKINTLTVMVMQVPCCAGLVFLARDAAASAARKIPIKRIVVGLRGEILSEEWI